MQFEAVRGTLASMTNGICDLGYKLGQDTASLMSAVSGGNASLSRQLADCCCANQRAIDAAKYDMASGFCQTNTNIDKSTFQLERYVDHKFEQAQSENRAGFQGLRDYLVGEKISALENELQSAQLALQNNSQTKAIMEYIDSKCHFVLSGISSSIFCNSLTAYLTMEVNLYRNPYHDHPCVSGFLSVDIQNSHKVSNYSLFLFLLCYR